MQYTFHLEGSAYSSNKEAFKELLKRHGLRWRGTFDAPWWGSPTEKVEATFERDVARDVTVSATLRWMGPRETAFLRALQAWVIAAGGHGERERKEPEVQRPGGRRELEFWDFLNKPDERYMLAEGRPRRWIDLDLDQWRRRRRQKQQELKGDHGDQGAERTSRKS